jgi:hypothetical protein
MVFVKSFIDTIPLVDNQTIKVSADGRLYVNFDGQTVGYSPSVGKVIVPIDNATIKVIGGYISGNYDNRTIGYSSSAGAVIVPIDNSTIKINASGYLSVPYDNSTVKLGSSGFYVPLDNSTVKVGGSGLYVPIDNATIKVIGGYVAGNYDQRTVGYSSTAGKVIVPLDYSTVGINSSGLVSVLRDNVTIKATSSGLAVAYDNATIKASSSVGLYGNYDNSTVGYSSSLGAVTSISTFFIYDPFGSVVHKGRFAAGSYSLVSTSVPGQIITITSSQSYQFPSGYNLYILKIQGGGAGGNPGPGAGGGAGKMAVVIAPPGATGATISIGAGGSSGYNGGNTSVTIGNVTYTASGGLAGAGQPAVNYNGGDGGTSFFGMGGRGGDPTYIGGGNGYGYGSGGGGGGANSTTCGGGGTGAPGVVVIECYNI